MKEITVQLDNKIADLLAHEASERGLSSAEFIKYILGTVCRDIYSHSNAILFPTEDEIADKFREFVKKASAAASDPSLLEELKKPALMQMARDGALQCKNCTMKISPDDLEKGACGSCNAPLEGMFKEL